MVNELNIEYLCPRPGLRLTYPNDDIAGLSKEQIMEMSDLLFATYDKKLAELKATPSLYLPDSTGTRSLSNEPQKP